ncbi:MAG: sensor histidine kinase [Bacteroidota bacterium]
MLIKLAIILSIFLQVLAAILAINLAREVRFNRSWILLTLALLLMAVRRVVDYLPFVYRDVSETLSMINTWIAVLTSVLITLGIYFIRRIFRMIGQAEAARRSIDKIVLNTIIKTEESERRRIARDLHDGLGPLLSNLKMSVSALEQNPGPGGNREVIASMKVVAEEALSSIKEISNNLSPHLLDNFGLHRAIEMFIEKLSAGSQVKFRLRSNIREVRFGYNTEIVTYRVLCELINNSLKHAGSEEIKINIFVNLDQMIIRYRDNGRGVDLKAGETSGPGMGISNMETRIRSLGGAIEFRSEPGSGFAAIIQVPVKIRS